MRIRFFTRASSFLLLRAIVSIACWHIGWSPGLQVERLDRGYLSAGYGRDVDCPYDPAIDRAVGVLPSRPPGSGDNGFHPTYHHSRFGHEEAEQL
ncbi:hypothetical protein HD806DRAFT_219119 [Xylariaceae sp. AK1471]|nr:hypothetical protein HD806DRAFT_219119 [Xylariaceae sp. AK1471]